jgi:hypothetical protein
MGLEGSVQDPGRQEREPASSRLSSSCPAHDECVRRSTVLERGGIAFEDTKTRLTDPARCARAAGYVRVPTLSGVMSLGPRAEKTGDDKDKGRKQNDERELGVDS